MCCRKNDLGPKAAAEKLASIDAINRVAEPPIGSTTPGGMRTTNLDHADLGSICPNVDGSNVFSQSRQAETRASQCWPRSAPSDDHRIAADALAAGLVELDDRLIDRHVPAKIADLLFQAGRPQQVA